MILFYYCSDYLNSSVDVVYTNGIGNGRDLLIEWYYFIMHCSDYLKSSVDVVYRNGIGNGRDLIIEWYYFIIVQIV